MLGQQVSDRMKHLTQETGSVMGLAWLVVLLEILPAVFLTVDRALDGARLAWVLV